MKRKTVISGIVIFWLIMMGWFIRFEAFPGRFAHTLAGYRGLFPSGPLVLDSWMKIMFQDKPIGYSHTRMDTRDRDPTEQYKLRNYTVLQLNMLGQPQDIVVSSEAGLDVLYELQTFSFSLTSGRYTARVDGRRIGEHTFFARVMTAAGAKKLKVEIPSDVVLYSPFLEMSLGKLKPGQMLRVKTFDPASMTAADVVCRAIGREKKVVGGRERDTTVLSIEFQGLDTKAWMTDDGEIVRQETPFGWTMEASTPEEALSLKFASKGGGDILKAVAVPCIGKLKRPEGCRQLRLRLSGTSTDVAQLASNRQKVECEKKDAGEVTLLVNASVPPSGARARGEIPEGAKAYLEATPFVQSDHPDMIKQAAKIVGDRTDPVEKARAIYQWVYKHVEKVPTASLPSALDVLKNLQGDCNEHTYLFVGLARAVGLPAQIRIGLVYHEGAFYYHAWPAVWVGDWWEMDPTLGQESVDATHICLLEGELASQLKLLGMVGKLKVKVVGEVD